VAEVIFALALLSLLLPRMVSLDYDCGSSTKGYLSESFAPLFGHYVRQQRPDVCSITEGKSAHW
jgi:hypothetical protein